MLECTFAHPKFLHPDAPSSLSGPGKRKKDGSNSLLFKNKTPSFSSENGLTAVLFHWRNKSLRRILESRTSGLGSNHDLLRAVVAALGCNALAPTVPQAVEHAGGTWTKRGTKKAKRATSKRNHFCTKRYILAKPPTEAHVWNIFQDVDTKGRHTRRILAPWPERKGFKCLPIPNDQCPKSVDSGFCRHEHRFAYGFLESQFSKQAVGPLAGVSKQRASKRSSAFSKKATLRPTTGTTKTLTSHLLP